MGIFNFKQGLSNAKKSSLSILQDIILRKIDNRYSLFDDTINVYGSDEISKCIFLRPNNERPLFGVSLSGTSNIPVKLSNFEEMVRNHSFKDDARIIVFYNKSKMLLDGIHEDFCTKQNVYLFTPVQQIAEEIAYFFETDTLSPNEIMNALFDIGMVNRYYNDTETFDIHSAFDIGNFTPDDMGIGFRSIFAEGVYNAISRDNECLSSKYKLYQGIGSIGSFPDKHPDMKQLMREKWHGYIAFIFDFNERRVKGYIAETRSSTRNFEKNKEIRNIYKELKDEVEEGGLGADYCVNNIYALIDNPSAINRISSALNVTFIEKSVFRKKIIYGTPITQRDGSCDGLGFSKDNASYIQAIHKRHNIKTPKSNDIYGVDIMGNYISYSFSETGESPHWSMIAPTRSGKTFWIMKMVSQSIGAHITPKSLSQIMDERDKGYALIPLDKVEYCTRLGDRRVVQFDVGYSALKFATELKRRYPDDVILFKDDLDNLRFGLTDIRFNYNTNQLNQEDINFSLSIISLILELNGEKILSAQERGEIEEALTRIFIEDIYTGKELIKLEEYGGYDEVIEKLKEKLGDEYDPYARTTELGLRGTDLDFIQKPLLSDVIKELSNKANNVMTKENDRKACENAISKLKVITKSDIFSLYSKSSIKDSFYFYMELETIKGLGANIFLPIFMTIFQKLYRRDVLRAQWFKDRNKVPPKVYYIIEEAHNFTGIESLKKLFEILLRESARYNIHLGFITQDANDLPEELINNIGTRIVMPSNSISGEQLKKGYWGTGDKAEIPSAFYDRYKEKYYAFVNYGKGVVTIKPPVSEAEERLFNSNPTEIKKALGIEDEEEHEV